MTYRNVSKSHKFYTPNWLTEVIIPYIREGSRIWEPACGEGHLVNRLKEFGFHVVGTDIEQGVDFIKDDLLDEDEFDCIITNPPFDLKDQFLAKCIQFNKPFALLLPLYCLEGTKRSRRHDMYRSLKDVSVIIPSERCRFINGDKNPNFSSVWVCSGFNLRQQLIWVDVDSNRVADRS
jgi:hypothetical protein